MHHPRPAHAGHAGHLVRRLSVELPLLEQACQANKAGSLVQVATGPVRRRPRVRARHDPTLP
jgi:hypothetical protein